MFSECDNRGMSGSCSIDECSDFWAGDCPRPGEILGFVEDISLLGDEECQQILEVYPDTYKLYGLNQKRESVMSNCKEATKIKVQTNDRIEATKKLESAITELSNGSKAEVFFDDNCREIFNKTIHVPVKVVCLDTNGERKVFINAFEANGKKLSVVVSEELIQCLQALRTEVDGIDAGLGCENLNAAASKLE